MIFRFVPKCGTPRPLARGRTIRCAGRLRLCCAVVAALAAIVQPAPARQVYNLWEPIGPTLATVFTLERDPTENGELYAGTNFGGMYRSSNGGLTWTHVAAPFAECVDLCSNDAGERRGKREVVERCAGPSRLLAPNATEDDEVAQELFEEVRVTPGRALELA